MTQSQPSQTSQIPNGPPIPPPPPPMYASFIEELKEVLNRHGKDSEANTPDFILASFLDSVLTSFIHSMQWRDQWATVDPMKPQVRDAEGNT